MSANISKISESLSPTSAAKVERLALARRRGWTPPPRVSVPVWADKCRKLAKEAGSSKGKWDTSRVEIGRGPMLAATEPGVSVITVMCCTQLLKTSLIENIFGYRAHLDPCPILIVQPKDDAAEQFSKERITPMVRATPVLRKLVGTSKTRAADETLTYKAFPGGFLALAGAGSPDNLARRPVCVVLFDEVDKYPVTKEGDPIALGEERQATFETGALSVRACSPTVEDASRIAASYAESDQRRASVACPHCGHRQFLDFFQHVEWEKERDEKGQVIRHLHKTARIYCEACGTGWVEGERLKALAMIRWHQTKPFTCCGRNHSPLDDYQKLWREKESDSVDRVWFWWEGDRWAVYRARCFKCGKLAVDNDHAGFQASKLFSPWQKDRPQDIARKWVEAQGDEEKLQTWWNTQNGLPYRPRIGRDLQPNAMLERREVWAADVPDGVVIITFGVDVADDRLEVEFVGWGRGEESWSLRYEILEGDPDQEDVWNRLDVLLQKPLLRADGRPFLVAGGCVDSGAHTSAVYSFCRARRNRRIWAVKGGSELSGQRNPVWPSAKFHRKQSRDYRPVILGTNAAKDRISACLQIEVPGRGYMHFPADRGAGYFAQLTGERLVVVRRSGRSYRQWKPKRGQAVEALDCRVYAYAALWGLIMQHKLDVDQEAKRIGAAEETPVVRVGTSEAQRIESQKQQPIAVKPIQAQQRPKRRMISRGVEL